MATGEDPADAAQTAAIDTILSHYDPETIDDLDVTTTFEAGELTVDVYLHVADEDTADVVTEAIEAATAAVDALFEE